jgi:hypothetical protein
VLSENEPAHRFDPDSVHVRIRSSDAQGRMLIRKRNDERFEIKHVHDRLSGNDVERDVLVTGM